MGKFAIAMAIAFFVPLFLVLIVGKKKDIDKEAEKAGAAQAQEEKTETAEAPAEKIPAAEKIENPVDGEVIPLAKVGDGVFSSGAMGDGVGIIPEGETVYAPCAAKVTGLIEESKHAVGLTLANGMEVLIHVGIDTVDMKGKGFAYQVKDGDIVEQGTPLLTFSRKDIQAAGHPDTVIMIVTETNDVPGMQMHSGSSGKAGTVDVITW